MFTVEDQQTFASRGITEAQVMEQLECFKKGFPYLTLEGPASVKNNGIVKADEAMLEQAATDWDAYLNANHRIVKFVPASGAASRMFKNLFEFLNGGHDEPVTDFEHVFFDHIEFFGFYAALNAKCVELYEKDINALMAEGSHRKVVAALLNPEGLNFGQLPKGLLLFHLYADDTVRTPLEEHLVEGALYAQDEDKNVHVHFTVSPEHRELFMAKVASVVARYEAEFGVKYDITFSEQKASTDTIAADKDNNPFRDTDGSLVFRPGGHGALIENLNDLDADVVFIKNIDNVVPDRLKDDTVTYKKLLAGVLVSLQAQAFAYLRRLDEGSCTDEELQEMVDFLQNKLCCQHPAIETLKGDILVTYLKKKLNRPMRVCGMVQNVGEPGGGPFLAYNADGTVSLQILESSQIDMDNPVKKAMFLEGTHFNPVDLVCAIKDYKGEKFDLPTFVDKSTGFISSKSKGGRSLKALELPGLWNGAMSDWNTIFVEVPLTTFNPVKTVNDLLRDQHQK
ncbi:MAG: DUF4301 family protein [Bacteroidaceae bacterium]|nr:DUF4301 family protein [Bacteroidaceae bacterium]